MLFEPTPNLLARTSFTNSPLLAGLRKKRTLSGAMFTRPTEYPDAAAAQGTNYIVDVHVAFYEPCVFQDTA